MRNIMIVFWKKVIIFINWYFSRNKLGMTKGPCWTMALFVIIALLTNEFDLLAEELLGRVAIASIVLMLYFGCIFAEDKWLKKLTKRYGSPVEVMKEFSNVSYLYGMVFWFITGEFFIRTSLYTMFNIRIGFAEFTIVSITLFTFLWFTYHIYVNDRLGTEKQKLGIIKQKLQLFAAVVSSISALFVIVEMWKELKILITLLALVYTWLRYFIDAESMGKQEGTEV